MARRTARRVVLLPMLTVEELVRLAGGNGPSGRGYYARVILTGMVLTLAPAALAALGPVRR